jgi:YesN/AraC family two-component response regulator
MAASYERYNSGCRMISVPTNLEVHLFDEQGNVQIHYARYDLPAVLERLKQEALLHILPHALERDHVYVFHDLLQLEFLVAGLWDEAVYTGTIVVGPCVSKAYHPQMFHDTNQQERVLLFTQKQLQQYYATLTMVDEAKRQAIGYLLINIALPGTREPQLIETDAPSAEGAAVKFKYELEQNREIVEKRYTVENKILHAITNGDAQMARKATQELRRVSWPYRHPNAPVRSMKNLTLSHNTLFRKAAESAGVHPLYLDSISGKFAIQIEQVQSIGELEALYEELPQAYCRAVSELALTALPALIKEAVIYLRLNIDQPISLHQLADTFGVHPSYLSRAFKKALGLTLTDYINKLRIEEAKYLLDQGDASVASIALNVGYNDPNYFSKVFAKLEHMTPHDYRKRKK